MNLFDLYIQILIGRKHTHSDEDILVGFQPVTIKGTNPANEQKDILSIFHSYVLSLGSLLQSEY